MLGLVLFGDHFVHRWLVLHGASDRQLRGFFVVLVDFLVVVCVPVNEHAADDDQVIGLILRNNSLSNRLGDSVSDSLLSWSKHLNGLLGTFDRHFGDHDGGWFDSQVWLKNGQQVAVSSLLVSQ